MAPIAPPRVHRTAQNTQHAYNFGGRIHDVKTYPILSPQGASILIYGYDSGVVLVWRGGQQLKGRKPGSATNKSNGANADAAVMILDSDDEDALGSASKSTPFVDKPEFEDASADDAANFPAVVQTLDLFLGTAVLKVAVLPLAPSKAEDAAWTGADILKTHMVFAVSCATTDIYVVTIPLTPPSHESLARPELRKDLLAAAAGKGVWGETLTLLGGQCKHSDGLAVALVKNRQAASERAKSVERTGVQLSSSTRVVVASHTREASGILRFWDVVLATKLEHQASKSRVEAFQTEYLPTPLKRISFNPSHGTQLLTIASQHAVRIYDYALPSLPEDISEGPFPTQGSWLLSLYPPFCRGPAMSTSRKPIVDAAWITGGRAILTLLADGQWGIWDIDGAGPSSIGGNPGLFGKQASGLRGAALTTFASTGYLEGTSPLRHPASQKSPAATASGEFVPMTPHTRREALNTSMTGGPERLASVGGGIAILQAQPLRAANPAALTDESAVLWIGNADPIVVVIPGISKFWEAQLRRGAGGGVNLFSGAQPTRMIRLTDLSVGLSGERCTGVGVLVRPSRQQQSAFPSNGAVPASESAAGSIEGLPIDILIRGESRLVVVRESEDSAPATGRLFVNRKKQPSSNRHASAIITYPRQKPSSAAFNLSVTRGGGNRHASHKRGPLAGLFGPTVPDVLPSTETDDDAGPDTRELGPRDNGFAFAQSLNLAADAVDDEDEAEERDVEEEMLDIMEIDRELEEMESERDSGKKHVFFEEGSGVWNED